MCNAQTRHFEVAIADSNIPVDSGGFLTDNDGGKREHNPRFCHLPNTFALKNTEYSAGPCWKLRRSSGRWTYMEGPAFDVPLHRICPQTEEEDYAFCDAQGNLPAVCQL